jgi:hypothetical protein
MHKFAAEMIDEAFASRFPRNIDEVLGEVVERAIGRVVGQNLSDAAINLDEIADEVVAEELDALPEETKSLIDDAFVEAIAHRAKDMLRGEVKSSLRVTARKANA